MSTGTKIRHELALIYANRIVEHLRLGCERIEIAGSIRRQKSMVGDIEIVFVPRLQVDMFGDPSPSADLVWSACEAAVFDGFFKRPAKKGDRYRQYPMPIRTEGVTVNVDLFAVLPPATWGAIFAIRTGPADYSQMLVSRLRERGLRCQDGRVLDAMGRVKPADTEEQFFELCGVPWVVPEKRG